MVYFKILVNFEIKARRDGFIAPCGGLIGLSAIVSAVNGEHWGIVDGDGSVVCFGDTEFFAVGAEAKGVAMGAFGK